jgi:hypothetical protein
MAIEVHVPKLGTVKLKEDVDFVARGGQANIYRHSNYAFKIYHDKKDMIHPDKVGELIRIDDKNPIGYIMDFVGGGYPLCKFFTRNFKKDNNISPADIADLTTEIQKTVASIHTKDCLIVDLNEIRDWMKSRLFKRCRPHN